MIPPTLQPHHIIYDDTPCDLPYPLVDDVDGPLTRSTEHRFISVKHVVVVYFSPSEIADDNGEYCTKHRVKAQEVIKTQRCVAERLLKPYKSDERALSDHIDCSWAWLEVDNDAYGVDTDRIVK